MARVVLVLDTLMDHAAAWLPRAAVAIAILAVFGLINHLTHRALERLKRRDVLNEQLYAILSGSARGGLLIVGTLTALGTLGVDVSAIVAGLGLAGFAVGFALKDIISNFVAGVMLVVYRPFVERDYIVMTTVEGTVEAITLRHTRLRAPDNKGVVLIPNANLFANPIVVFKGGKGTPA